MKLRKPWQQRAAAMVGAGLLRAIGTTWRVEIRWPEDQMPGYYLFLHGQILGATWAFRGRGYPILIGTHRDAEIIARISAKFGYVPIRGSATRGGPRASLEMLRTWKDQIVAVTPDGPRGPRGSVKPALVQLAGRARMPLVPMSIVASRAKRLDSWDRFTIPAPFARILCTFGEPLAVPAGIDETRAQELAVEAGRRILETEAAAESEVATW